VRWGLLRARVVFRIKVLQGLVPDRAWLG
jgi:hypothetical protein